MPQNTDPNEIANRARGDIDTTLLTGTGTGGILSVGYFDDGPLIDHLEPDERLYHIVTNLWKGVEVERDNKNELISPARKYRTAGLVTDKRILFIVGQNDGDHLYDVPYTHVESAYAKTGILKDKLTIECPYVTYYMYTRKSDDTKAVVESIKTIAADATNHAAAEAETNDKTKPETTVEAVDTTSQFRPQASTEKETDDTSDSARKTEGKLADTDDTNASSPTPGEVPPLPTLDSVATIDEEAVQYVESAYELLVEGSKSDDRTVLIRAHTELCTALTHLHPADSTAVGKINRVVTQLEENLTNDIQSAKTTEGSNESDRGESESDGDKMSVGAPKTEESETTSDRERENVSLSIEVHVRDRDESPIGGAQVTLDNSSFQITGKTDSQGRCVLTISSAPKQETARLSIEHSNFESTSGLVSIGPDQVCDIWLEGEPGPSGTSSDGLEEQAMTDDPDRGRTPDAADDHSRAELLAELDSLGENRSEIDRELLYSVSDYHPDDFEEVFGSLNAALEEADISETDEISRKKELLAELQELDEQWSRIDRKLLYSVGDNHPDEYEAEFGSLDAALSAAGIGETADSKSDSGEEDQMEQALREVGLIDESSESPEENETSGNQRRTELIAELQDLDRNWTHIDRKLLYSVGDNHPDEYEAEFGSLDAALSAAGVSEAAEFDAETEGADETTTESDSQEISERSRSSSASDGVGMRYTKDDILEEIRTLTDELGHPPSTPEFTKHGQMSPTLAYRHFDKWADALTAAGVTGDQASSSRSQTDSTSQRGPTSKPTGKSSHDDLEDSGDITLSIPEGRVDTLDVTVLEYDADPGPRRDAHLQVQTENGTEVPLNIWSTHELHVDWTVGEMYTLEQSLYKVWDTSSGTRHELSSTKDLRVSSIEAAEKTISDPETTRLTGTDSEVSGQIGNTDHLDDEQDTREDDEGGDSIIEDILSDFDDLPEPDSS